MPKYGKIFGRINKLKSRLQGEKNVNGLKMFLVFSEIWENEKQVIIQYEHRLQEQ